MKILLLKDVVKVGQRGEIVEVKNGFGRNFLIRQKLGVRADAESIRVAQMRKAQSAAKHSQAEQSLREYEKHLGETILVFKKKANEKGHLFAGITAHDIEAELHHKGFSLITKDHIEVEHLKAVGEHTIPISLGKKKVLLRVMIEPI